MVAAETKPTASEKLQKIYFSVGFAITQWQQVELALTQLFCILMSPRKSAAASAALAAVLNFRTKLDIVDSTAYVAVGKTPLFAEWTTLYNALRRKAAKRNDIAHFMLYQKAVVHSPDAIPDIA